MSPHVFSLFDTLSRSVKPLPTADVQKIITFYTCGPTVYDHTHIGHMRKYVMDDILKKTLQHAGYEVKHTMNITDVGHLTGDDDSGDDKLEKGAAQKGMSVWEVAKKYEKEFWQVMEAMGVSRPDSTLKATEHISDMIDLITILCTKGYTYETVEALYFDTSKFTNYGALSGQSLSEKKEGVRTEVNIDTAKRHPADFALWFKRTGRFQHHVMHWPSPWGDGFPGWHIECSAMSMKALESATIDIHTGGIDHIPVHHENEIAQSEAATGKQFVKFWVHHAFLQVEGEKMSKSKQNFFTLPDVAAHNIEPAALRYLFLQTHYRKPLNFTWESAKAAQNGLQSMRDYIRHISQNQNDGNQHVLNEQYTDPVDQALFDDLNTPQALAGLWNMIRSDLANRQKIQLIKAYDLIFCLGLLDHHEAMIPAHIQELANQRQHAKKEKNYALADSLRKQIEREGYLLEDSENTYRIRLDRSC